MAAASRTILNVSDLTKRFAGVTALDRVSFDLVAGEIHALCGENGAGKSTLIKCLSGIWPYGSYEGAIAIDGEPVRFSGIRDSEEAGIAVIYQELGLVNGMTVAENMYLGSEPVRSGGLIDWNRLYQQAQALLDKYGLALDPTARVEDLGVGKQQLVEIAKALAKDLRILLLDEPTSALTESEVDILLGIIMDLKAQGITCVYISHKLEEVFRIADRITVLRDGTAVSTRARGACDKASVIRDMVGREINDFFPRRKASPGNVLLSIENLTVLDPASGRHVIDNVDLELRAGEVLGLGGLMGAGRTELLMHIFGGVGKRVNGRVLLLGREVGAASPWDMIRNGLVLVTEDRKQDGLVLEQDIGFNLSLSSLAQFSKGGLIDRNAEFRKNRELFDSLQIKAPDMEALVISLSGGNQQKVLLGKALMTEPQVVFLDEPTRGIDVGAKVEIYALINRLTAANKAVVLVSSELPELMGMSDRIVILSNGRVGGVFTKELAQQEALLAAAMVHH